MESLKVTIKDEFVERAACGLSCCVSRASEASALPVVQRQTVQNQNLVCSCRLLSVSQQIHAEFITD